MRFLFVDRIIELSQSLMAKGLKHVTRDDYYLCQDNTDSWCFIPSLMGETIGQLAAWHVMVKHDFRLRPVAGIAASATFYRPAYIGDTLLLETQIDTLDNTVVQYHGEARIDGELAFQLEGALGPLLPMNDFIDESVVRHQFNEINRPLLPTHMDMYKAGSFNQDTLIANNQPTLFAADMAFDRVVACEPGVRIVAVKCVTRAAPYFPDHFPNKPVLPMTVLLESFLNLAQEFAKRSGLSGVYVCEKVRRVKMSDFIHPGDIITAFMTLKHQTEKELVFVCRCDVSGKRVGVLEVTMRLQGDNE